MKRRGNLYLSREEAAHLVALRGAQAELNTD